MNNTHACCDCDDDQPQFVQPEVTVVLFKLSTPIRYSVKRSRHLLFLRLKCLLLFGRTKRLIGLENWHRSPIQILQPAVPLLQNDFCNDMVRGMQLNETSRTSFWTSICPVVCVCSKIAPTLTSRVRCKNVCERFVPDSFFCRTECLEATVFLQNKNVWKTSAPWTHPSPCRMFFFTDFCNKRPEHVNALQVNDILHSWFLGQRKWAGKKQRCSSLNRSSFPCMAYLTSISESQEPQVLDISHRGCICGDFQKTQLITQKPWSFFPLDLLPPSGPIKSQEGAAILYLENDTTNESQQVYNQRLYEPIRVLPNVLGCSRFPVLIPKVFEMQIFKLFSQMCVFLMQWIPLFLLRKSPRTKKLPWANTSWKSPFVWGEKAICEFGFVREVNF